MRAALALLTVAMLLVGCSSEHEDMKAWMKEASKDMRGRVDKLPDVQQYIPVSYEAQSLLDPFSPGKIVPEKRAGGGAMQPDMNRRRETLESYPLESLQLVGVVQRKGVVEALVVADRAMYSVKVGNYMGQNFGVITRITDTEIQMKEMVQDAQDGWVERPNKLLLQEGAKGGNK